MKGIFLICYVLFSMNFVETKDATTIQFVKSFIKNEKKPTNLVCLELCWGKNVQITLQKELIKASTIFSTKFIDNMAYTHHQHHLLFLADLDCPNGMEILRISHLRTPHRWLVLSHPDFQLKGKFEELPILLDSDFVLAERSAPTAITMTELYKSTPNGSLIYATRGHFNGTLVDSRQHREQYRRRNNVYGHHLTMSNVIQDSNTTMYHLPREDRLEPQFDAMAKIAWSNVRLAFDMINATPRYIFSHRYGFKQNGTWSGMIDDIYSGRADLGTDCVANTERLPIVVYTDSLAPYNAKFILRQPPLPYVANIFALPFSASVWTALALCVALSTFTVYLASRWEVNSKSPSQLDGTIGDALLLTMSALSQQGCAMEPKRISGRIMLLVVFTTLMALYAAYSANIVVLLQAPSNAIQTLEQLAQSKITIAAYDADYNHYVFRLYQDPVRVLIRKRLEPERGTAQFFDFNEGVERIRKGLFAFHSMAEPVYRRIQDTFLEHEKCDLMEVDFLNIILPLIPVKRDSPYLELLRVTFKQLREVGVQSALYRRLQVPKPRCADRVSSFSSVSFNDLRPVLVFMLYGYLVSIIIMFLEVFHCHLKRRNKNSFDYETSKVRIRMGNK